VLKLRSINNNVTPAVNTGNDNNNNIAVKNIAQTNNGISIMCTPILRMFKVVTIKLIAPNNDEILVRCNANIAKSTDGPECALIDDSGGYTVHPVPAPDSIKIEPIIHTNAGGKHQKLILFNLANAISTAPIIIGKKKFPLEMDVKVTFKTPQRTVRASHPAYGSPEYHKN
jgi:hypothetical protein